MPELRGVSGQEAIRALERLGFEQARQSGSHVVLKKQAPEGTFGCGVWDLKADKRGSEIMDKERYIYWKDEDMWIGYLERYPDYMTQGETIEELKENLKDIYGELTRGDIPCVRELAELEIA